MKETKLKKTLMFKFLFALASGAFCAVVAALVGVLFVISGLIGHPSLEGVGWVVLAAFGGGFVYVFFYLLEISHYTEHDVV